jgi:hypothetical protein
MHMLIAERFCFILFKILDGSTGKRQPDFGNPKINIFDSSNRNYASPTPYLMYCLVTKPIDYADIVVLSQVLPALQCNGHISIEP